MKPRMCYAEPPPGVDLSTLTGLLIVIEGPDSSGRSTQVALLREWLEQQGYGVASAGLKRSPLVAPALERAQQGNTLSPRTMSLFYATDFYDQLENQIVPALRAGYVVLADRYIFTLMARDCVRGADVDWVASLYSRAIVPDAVFYLSVSTPTLVERALKAHARLDYWESGMDLGLSRDWMESFVIYQRRIRAQFRAMQKPYRFIPVNANRSVKSVQHELQGRATHVIETAYAASRPPPTHRAFGHDQEEAPNTSARRSPTIPARPRDSEQSPSQVARRSPAQKTRSG